MLDMSMYEYFNVSSNAVVGDDRRRHMSLDLASSPQRKCFSMHSQVESTTSKVASPDLEAFLLYSSVSAASTDLDCMAATDNTPTQILFPKSVTAEQEAYARGFVDALEELHRRQGAPSRAPSAAPAGACSQMYSTDNNAVVAGWTTDFPYQLRSAVPVREPPPGSDSACRVPPPPVESGRPPLTDEALPPQTVPRLSCLTPPSSPDVDAAIELARVDRKRERNRLAAQKCRSRKLEQICVLESRCGALRAENGALSRTADQLADSVSTLRRQLTQHTTSTACRINSQHLT